MTNKRWLIAAVILVVVLGIWAALRAKATVIDKDTSVKGDFEVKAGEKVVLKNGAKLTVEGALNINGELKCENGPINISGSQVRVKKSIRCERSGNEGDTGAGIAIVAKKGFVMDEDATFVTNGQAQIVDDESKLAKTKEDFEKLFEEAGKNTGAGPRIGPLSEEGMLSSYSGIEVMASFNASMDANVQYVSANNAFVKTAFAQGNPNECIDQNGNLIPDCVRISGNWVVGHGQNLPPGVSVPTPQKGINKIILNFNFGPGKEVHLVDFNLAGPDGRKGDDDNGASCNAKGKDGENAFRFLVSASNITVNNLGLWLGNGGDGGSAETKKDCDPGIAAGGKGGEPGNFKMMASGKFKIVGAFNITPGRGGRGGDATANGKDGVDACPGEKGGDAVATSGMGGNNNKKLFVEGAVGGTSNISIGPVFGGDAGVATARPGKGGNGTGCNCNGGAGGNGTATGSKGGNASLAVLGAAGTSNGGKGGDADSLGGQGGNGGQCPLKPKGGNGGKGGDANSKKGSGGTGTTANGADGNVVNETGGNGGNGGDGCGPGSGGKGGKGNPPGVDGKPGKLVCPEEKKDGTSVTTPPNTGNNQTTPPGGGNQTPPPAEEQKVRVINYNGKYLPVDQLIVENEEGCGAPHWHAARGAVKATDGSIVQDPGPQCGYGKTQSMPVMEVQVQISN